MFSALWMVLLLPFALLPCDAVVEDLIVMIGERSACPQYYSKIKTGGGLNGDINQDAGGEYVWLCVKEALFSQQDQGLTDLRVIARGSSQSGCSPLGSGWNRIGQYYGSNGDLNQGAGGEYVYLCYQKISGDSPIVDLQITSGDCDRGMYRIRAEGGSNGDLSQGAGGEYIYLCKKVGCVAEEVQGKWVPHGTIAAAVTETWEHGTEKRHSESETEDWSQSVSVTVEQGWSLYGQDGSVSITGSFAHATSSTYSKEWSVATKHTYQITWSTSDIGKTAWQFQFSPTDSCGHSETSLVKEFALTEGQYRPPCCVPGYATDAPAYKVCKGANVMIKNGGQYGCIAVSEIAELPDEITKHKKKDKIEIEHFA